MLTLPSSLRWGFVCLLSSLTLIFAACPRPEIPDDVYALTLGNTSFITGAMFDIVCVPGNRPETTAQLRCDGSGEWHGQWPDCSKFQNNARWWELMLGMVGAVVLIPCILPRWYYGCTSSPRSDNFKNMRNSSSDVIRMQTYSNPQTQSSVSVESHPSLDKYSLPLSPARGPSDEDF